MILTGCIAGMVAALCTWTRRFLERENYETDALWQGRVQIKKHYNRGAGFGLPGLRGRGLIAASCAALLLFLASGLHSRKPLATGLILGGGFSNLWERLCHGRVLDYICFPKAPGFLKRYLYNLADISIFLGVILSLLRRGRK